MKWSRRTARLAVSALAVVAITTMMPGCYREVIDAKGIGADQSYPRRAKSSQPKIDQGIDQLFGEKKP